MKSILDPKFKYTNSASTDLRKTFARIRRERAQARQQEGVLCDEQRTITTAPPVQLRKVK